MLKPKLHFEQVPLSFVLKLTNQATPRAPKKKEDEPKQPAGKVGRKFRLAHSFMGEQIL
jgi:hypothetical protein